MNLQELRDFRLEGQHSVCEHEIYFIHPTDLGVSAAFACFESTLGDTFESESGTLVLHRYFCIAAIE